MFPLTGPWMLVAKLVAIAAAAAALIYAWHAFTDHYREQGRAEVRIVLEAERADRKAERERRIAMTTAITNEWDRKRQEAERAATERDQARAERSQAIKLAARDLPKAVADARVAPAFVGVLRASRDFANAAGPAAQPDETAPAAAAGPDAESTLGLVAEWVAEVAEIHAECRDRVSAWESFYASLRAAQPKGSDP